MQKLAEAFEAQFFNNVQHLGLDPTLNKADPRASMQSAALSADESRFFENMTIHK